VWTAVDAVLGRSVPAQILSVGLSGLAGAGVYWAAVLWMGMPEARQVRDLLARRLGR
jgi:hypothetical protein